MLLGKYCLLSSKSPAEYLLFPSVFINKETEAYRGTGSCQRWHLSRVRTGIWTEFGKMPKPIVFLPQPPALNVCRGHARAVWRSVRSQVGSMGASAGKRIWKDSLKPGGWGPHRIFLPSKSAVWKPTVFQTWSKDILSTGPSPRAHCLVTESGKDFSFLALNLNEVLLGREGKSFISNQGGFFALLKI